MNKAIEFLKDGSATLKTVLSPLNGKLTVKWDLLSGYQIMGGGLWQVGGPVETVWEKALETVLDNKNIIKQALILGMGGGTTAKLIRKNWRKAKITGVEIDPVIVKLGEDYLGLTKLNVNTCIGDALDFVAKSTNFYDLICIDTYVGSSFPAHLGSEKFFNLVRKRLSPSGVVLVNRIFESSERVSQDKFYKKLNFVFGNVYEVYPSKDLVNVVFVCSVL